MAAGRPSLSRPSYGSMTGRINWMRGVSDMLAQPPVAVAPPVAAAPAPAPTSTGKRAGHGGAGSDDRYYMRDRYFQR